MLYQKNRIFHSGCILPYYLLREVIPETQSENITVPLNRIGKTLSEAYQLFDDLRDKEKNSSVHHLGFIEVRKMLEERLQTIRENIRKIQKNSNLEKLIESIFGKAL